MASTCARLHNILTTEKAAATISAAKTPIPIKSTKLISMKELAEEPNLEELAQKFKLVASQSTKFRNRRKFYDFTIGRLANSQCYSLIEDILESHKHFDDITREGFTLRLLSLYSKAGMFGHARKLFDELPELNCQRTVKSLNALLKAGVESKRFDDVFAIFKEVPSKLSISCDVVSYNTVIHALCEMGSLEEGLLMLDEMKEMGISPSVVTFNTLLDAFYREKGFEGGEKIWALMDEYNVGRDIRSYNLKLQGFVNEGQLEPAIVLFELLESADVNPDVDTFNVLMKGYCDQGNVEAAKRWYSALLESGATPNSITFSVMVPVFCDSGDFFLALELCKKMFKRQFVVDEALLQFVVNGLVKESMIEEAEELVELGNSNAYVQYSLVLPLGTTEK